MTLVFVLLMASLMATLAIPTLLPTGGAVRAATVFACDGTKFFASAPLGTRFREGDTWQDGSFTDIENNYFMEVFQEGNGDIVGRFKPTSNVSIYGDTATISFPSDIHITAILFHDNDPKAGEAGWSLNGVQELTDDDKTEIVMVNITTSTVTIDAGGDSGGIDFCFTPIDGGGGGEGCTPGYWKVSQHHDS
ncbi:MAG: hypothetical protein M3153_09685, partial [Chloroflexota bacterium]|nr:hypothetical protein [Chloroflexota bacterium]